ncbi:DUF5065 domain-containing protein [Bacillus pseudomycoides]|uniref:DUF5065 domain-containing protein n=1 Tax=Bacillus pseudomycoides TaxID=64104 RepID=A0AA91V8A8_9BACI|nr:MULTISPECIES: DUF5065 family protein [Bacillus]PEB52332.1 DUF5065 domain-containing protein [Bacillus sp. AFS098217]PED80361.1 DUF5065 domain-containing protein [Bacillus pseudomycoides]
MKTLEKVALIGTIALGGITSVGLLETPKQVSAATKTVKPIQYAPPVVDGWRWETFFEIHHNADYLQELAVGNLKHGDSFDVNVQTGGKDTGIVKIYRINENGALQRYKTIYDSHTEHHYNGRFITKITPVYKPGKYVAIMKLGDQYYYGGAFNISK